MFVVNCQVCGSEIETQRASRKFCDACNRKRNAAIPRDREKQRAAHKRWVEKHPDGPAQATRRWYRKDPKHGQQCVRRYEKKHPEQKKVSDAKYYQRHKAEHNEQGKRWAVNNPEAYRASRNQRNHSRRARLAQAEGKWFFAEFQALCEASDNRCYYCQKQVDKLTADHMTPLARGGSNWIENIVPVCGSCNSSKGTSTLLEYFFPALR
jgi:hypothetical protein